MKHTLYIFLLLVGIVCDSSGQILNQGQGRIRLSQEVFRSDTYFNAAPGSMTERIRTNGYYFTSLSGEYGIHDRLTATVSFSFVRVTVNELLFRQSGNSLTGGALNSLGDADVGFAFTVRKKLPLQLIAFSTAGIPLGIRGTVGSETNLQTGDGEFNILSGIKLQQSFSKINVSGSIAFNQRSNNYSNEIRYGFEAMYSANRLQAKLRHQGIESLFNDTAPTSANGFFSNHKELFMPGMELRWRIANNTLLFTSADVAVAGRNTLKGVLLGAGVQFDWGKE